MRNIFKSTGFLAILACFLWSTAFVGVKIGLQYHTPFQFAGFRFILSGILIFLFVGKPTYYFNEVKKHFRFIAHISILQVFILYGLFYSGLNLVPGALGAMIIGSSPIFIAIVAHMMTKNDKLTLYKTISILIGIGGIVLITIGRSKIGKINYIEYLGIGLLIINNFAAGYANVLVSRYNKGLSSSVLSSSTLFIGGTMLFLISIPIEGIHLQPFPAEYYYSLLWLSMLSAVAITIWYSLLKRPEVKVSILNVWKFLIPISGAILSWIILPDEHPDAIAIVAMIVISLSLLILNYANRKEKQLLKKNSNNLN